MHFLFRMFLFRCIIRVPTSQQGAPVHTPRAPEPYLIRVQPPLGQPHHVGPQRPRAAFQQRAVPLHTVHQLFLGLL